MPSIPQPSAIIKCTDISSCFQSLYNFFFALLIALAFLNFLYGAFQYLISAGGVFSKEEGKRRMINSVLAVIIALSVPIILNMINPEIFKAKLYIPQVTVKLPSYNGLNAGYVMIDPNNPPPETGYTPPPTVRNQVSPYTCNEGVPLVKQTDPEFANLRYGNGYIGPSGCGIVSLAMIAAYCKGFCQDGNISDNEKNQITQFVINYANQAVNQGQGDGSRGTDISFINNYSSAGYQSISQLNFEQIKSYLNQGQKLIFNISDNLYTYGHYVVIYGTMDQCQIQGQTYYECLLINDPANGNYTIMPLKHAQSLTKNFIFPIDCSKM